MTRLFLFALSVLAGLGAGPASAQAPDFATGTLGSPRILQPAEDVSAMIFLFSDADGWSDDDERLAAVLADHGAIVVGVDLPVYLAGLEATGGECVYLVSDIESLSHQLQRASGSAAYFPPVLAGSGAGGALVLAIAAQTPDDTVARTLAVDPQQGIALRKPLCTPAPREIVEGSAVYGLTPGDLPDPVEIVFTPQADAAAEAHAQALRARGFAIDIRTATDAATALGSGLHDILAARDGGDGTVVDLPVVELPAEPRYDTLAIVYSGDGGWRDLDKTIAEILQGDGVPTVGVDSLRYFWSSKSPEDIAGDLSRLIDAYRAKWGVSHVALIGYSFGADILPLAYNRLSEAQQAAVTQISLLGLSTTASLEISVAGWLGVEASDATATLPEIARIDAAKLQCVYGADESDSACPQLEGSQVQLIETAGGHHFDGDYPALASQILSGLRSRLDAPAGQSPSGP